MTSGTAKRPDDTLSLLVNDRQLSGWDAVRVTRGLERCPSDFDIGLTDRFPADPTQISVEAGMPCEVKIGKDTVIAGFVDRVDYALSPHSHNVRIQGRSKCEDLTDCSIVPDILIGMQIKSSSLLDLATRLCAPFGIKVTVLGGADVSLSTGVGDPMQFNAVLTETGWDVLERVSRYLGLLLYDDTAGNLVIANVGTSTMATGFVQGQNVQSAAVCYSMDERFSTYLPCLMATNFLGQEGIGGKSFAPVLDKGVKRPRPLIVVSEQFQQGQPLAEKRAQWDAARRVGRSQKVRLTCDNWRDEAGVLWTPNAFAPINLPSLKLTPADPWVIGTVTFTRDADRGTVADLELMPKEAFQPQPVILQPFLYDPTSAPPSRPMLGHA